MLLFLLKESKTTSNEGTDLQKVIVPSLSISTDIWKLFLLQHRWNNCIQQCYWEGTEETRGNDTT